MLDSLNLTPTQRAAADHVIQMAENLAIAAALSTRCLLEGEPQPLSQEQARNMREDLAAAIRGLAAGQSVIMEQPSTRETVVSAPGSGVRVTRLNLSEQERDALRCAAARIPSGCLADQKEGSSNSAPIQQLTVSVTEMRESNGNVTYTAYLHPANVSAVFGESESYGFSTSASKGRVDYEADCMRRMLDPRLPEPCILDYNTDLPTV